MALWQCEGCPTVYAVGLPSCPHCGSTAQHEQGAPKPAPKSSQHNGRAATRPEEAASERP